jgi:hypothetical protein
LIDDIGAVSIYGLLMRMSELAREHKYEPIPKVGSMTHDPLVDAMADLLEDRFGLDDEFIYTVKT